MAPSLFVTGGGHGGPQKPKKKKLTGICRPQLDGWSVNGSVWRVNDGGWRVNDGGWRVKDGGWRVKDGVWRVNDGGWRVKNGVWRVNDGVWRVKDGGWRVTGSANLSSTLGGQPRAVRRQPTAVWPSSEWSLGEALNAKTKTVDVPKDRPGGGQRWCSMHQRYPPAPRPPLPRSWEFPPPGMR